MQKVTPFLWFDGKAEEAMNLYVSLFKNARIVELHRAGDNGPVMSGTFEIDGVKYHAFNGGPMFAFSPAVSLFVNCETQEEVDELWEKLSEGGEKSRCGWLKDKYGLSWQIIPSALGKGLKDKDPAKAKRVMQAMMQMSKIEIAEIEKARAG
jgi:predicted 3-demethylubiquinone-9 3-methyltransferase (glyoxalase superfamily)